MRNHYVWVCSAALYIATGCGGDGGTGPNGAPANIVLFEVSAYCQAGDLLAEPIRAQVLNKSGGAVSGVAVTFTSSGGSVTPAVATTDAQGMARTTLRCSTVAREFVSVRATFVGFTGVPPEINIAVTPAALAVVALGAPDSSLVVAGGGPLELPAVPEDAYENPIRSSLTINWRVESGGGSLAMASTTNPSRGVQNTWILGPGLGIQSIVLTVSEVPGFVQHYHVRVLGAAPKVVPNTPQSFVALVGTTLPSPLQVQVLTSDGTPLPRVLVHFSETPGVDTLTPVQGASVRSYPGYADVQSDANGYAAVRVTLRTVIPAEGPVVLIAAEPFLWGAICGCAASWTVTEQPGPPAAVLMTSGNNQAGTADHPLGLPLQVQVTDQYGNALAAQPVTWAVTSGGGSLGTTSTTTDSGGLTSNSWTLGATAGTQTVTATVGVATVTFTAQAS